MTKMVLIPKRKGIIPEWPSSASVITQMLKNDSITTSKIDALAVTAAEIAAGTITATEIAADAVTATKINVAGLNGTTGRIIVADATDANVVTGGVNTHATTLIAPGKVLISGATNLDDWSHGSDATKIDGGDIYTNTITATQIAADAIEAGQIKADAVIADKIIADAITTVKINDTAVTFPKLNQSSWVGRSLFYFTSFFESLDGVTVTEADSATATLDGDKVRLATGATINSRVLVYKNPIAGIYVPAVFTWDKNRIFRTFVGITAWTDQELWMNTGGAYDTAPTTRHIGFKVVDNILSGTVADGTTESTSALKTLSAAGAYDLEVIFTTGTSAVFYVDGVEEATITTNLPSGTTGAPVIYFYEAYNTATANKILDVAYMELWQER